MEYTSPRKYISGESHYYLGKQYLLKVIEAPNSVQSQITTWKTRVSVRIKNAEKVRKLLTIGTKRELKKPLLNVLMPSLNMPYG
ncbi:DUF45 domain-containing protein [Vibrio sp. PP-XX7]